MSKNEDYKFYFNIFMGFFIIMLLYFYGPGFYSFLFGNGDPKIDKGKGPAGPDPDIDISSSATTTTQDGFILYYFKKIFNISPSVSSKDIKYPNTEDNVDNNTQGVIWSFLSGIKNFFKKSDKTTVIKSDFQQGSSIGAFPSLTTDEKSTIASTFDTESIDKKGWYKNTFNKLLGIIQDPESPESREFDGDWGNQIDLPVTGTTNIVKDPFAIPTPDVKPVNLPEGFFNVDLNTSSALASSSSPTPIYDSLVSGKSIPNPSTIDRNLPIINLQPISPEATPKPSVSQLPDVDMTPKASTSALPDVNLSPTSSSTVVKPQIIEHSKSSSSFKSIFTKKK